MMDHRITAIYILGIGMTILAVPATILYGAHILPFWSLFLLTGAAPLVMWLLPGPTGGTELLFWVLALGLNFLIPYIVLYFAAPFAIRLLRSCSGAYPTFR